MEKRVQFDFEVEFSNGGGIQGQGFRLDIEGDDISDEELANYIVADMRLLMVGNIRILNKKIIEEAHKRHLLPSSISSSLSEQGQIALDIIEPTGRAFQTLLTIADAQRIVDALSKKIQELT